MEALQCRAPPGQRRLVKALAADFEHVEQHQLRGRFLRQPAHATFGGMQAHLQRLEIERIGQRNDELAIDREALFLHPREHFQHLGEEAAERLARSRDHLGGVAVAAGDAAKAIPLGLILPAVAFGQFGGEQGLHGRESCAAGHAPIIAGR